MVSISKNHLAILGGHKIRRKSFPSWPQFGKTEKKNLLQVLRSGRWERHKGELVSKFEQYFAELCGVKHALAVMNGSVALEIALRAAGIEVGDEVLVPPYTFMSTIMSILIVNALPVFVDIHPDTYCMDPQMIERQITPNTKAIMPVHLAGMPCDMDAIMNIAAKHNLVIIEDACQAHLAEWKGRKVGSIGQIGCFSFQVTKNISCGEGGAITSNNSAIMDRCFSFHTCGRIQEGDWYYHPYMGTNRRMMEFQAAILLAQLERVKDQMKIRSQNATYLSQQLSQIPGINPLIVPEFVTTHAYHLYIFRYNAKFFGGVHRDVFVKALQAEGIPCSTGYVPLYKEGFIKKAFETRIFQKNYGQTYLNHYFHNIHCPITEKACNEEGIWIPQSVLLGTKEDMDDILEAIRKLQEYKSELKRIEETMSMGVK